MAYHEAERILTIRDLSRSGAWAGIREAGEVEVGLEDQRITIELTSRPTPLGRYFYFLCPECSSRRLHLYAAGDRVACRGCFKILHPTQALPSSGWYRSVVRVSLQLELLERRLEKGGIERNLRRRLNRRRDRLTGQLEESLVDRMEKLGRAAIE